MAKNADGTWTLTYQDTGERIEFSEYGWMTKRADRNGVGTTYQWSDIAAYPDSITDAAGKRIELTYDSYGYLTGVSAAGRTTTLSRPVNPDTRVMSINYGAGRVATYTYVGALVESVNLAGKTVAFSYDAGGRVVQAKVSKSGEADRVTAFDYSVAGTTKVTDANGGVSSYSIDLDKRVSAATDQLGRRTSQTYDPKGNVESVTSSFSTTATTKTTYDSQNNATAITTPTGAATTAQYANGAACATSQTGNPHLPKCVSDAQGNVQTFEYDAQGNLLAARDKSGGGAAFVSTYQGTNGATCGGMKGQRCSSTDGNGNETRYSYTNGMLTKITPPAPLGATTMTYDAVGRVESVRDGRGQLTIYAYDAADRVTKVAYPSGQVLISVFNPDGTLKSESDGPAWIAYEYNALGAMTRQYTGAPAGSGIAGTIRMDYDKVGNLVSYDDGAGVVGYKYDAANQVKEMTEPGGTCPASGYPGAGSGCTKFDYDAGGKEK